MVFLEGFRVQVAFDDVLDEFFVLIIGDTTTIVDLRHQEVHHFVRHQHIFVQKHLQLLLRDLKIFVGEVVLNVPTNWTEFSSIQNNGVEETQREEEFLVNFGFFAVIQFLI